MKTFGDKCDVDVKITSDIIVGKHDDEEDEG
jgi:hypothetical protein